MSYSSYRTQQQMLERIDRLEVMLVALIYNTQGGHTSLATRDMLLNFAGVVNTEHNLEAALETQTEVTHAVENPE